MSWGENAHGRLDALVLGVATQSLYFTNTPGPENIARFNPLTPRLFMT